MSNTGALWPQAGQTRGTPLDDRATAAAAAVTARPAASASAGVQSTGKIAEGEDVPGPVVAPETVTVTGRTNSPARGDPGKKVSARLARSPGAALPVSTTIENSEVAPAATVCRGGRTLADQPGGKPSTVGASNPPAPPVLRTSTRNTLRPGLDSNCVEADVLSRTMPVVWSIVYDREAVMPSVVSSRRLISRILSRALAWGVASTSSVPVARGPKLKETGAVSPSSDGPATSGLPERATFPQFSIGTARVKGATPKDSVGPRVPRRRHGLASKNTGIHESNVLPS